MQDTKEEKVTEDKIVKVDFAKGERKKLPNRAFDKEYMTEWYREVQYLKQRGVDYSYVRTTEDYGVSQYKYQKTPKLFKILFEFYSLVEKERKGLDDEVSEILKKNGVAMKRNKNGEIRFSKVKADEEQKTPEISPTEEEFHQITIEDILDDTQ